MEPVSKDPRANDWVLRPALPRRIGGVLFGIVGAAFFIGALVRGGAPKNVLPGALVGPLILIAAVVYLCSNVRVSQRGIIYWYWFPRVINPQAVVSLSIGYTYQVGRQTICLHVNRRGDSAVRLTLLERINLRRSEAVLASEPKASPRRSADLSWRPTSLSPRRAGFVEDSEVHGDPWPFRALGV